VRKNIAAYTQQGAYYPGYYSLNEEERGDPTLTVRCPGQNGTQVASVPIPKDEMKKLADSIYVYLGLQAPAAYRPV
jgi:hypothetical protein